MLLFIFTYYLDSFSQNSHTLNAEARRDRYEFLRQQLDPKMN